jgi:hypothetical protein
MDKVLRWESDILTSYNFRVKLTCCATCSFIVLGTKAGTLYIHDNNTKERLLLVSSTEFGSTPHAITNISVSPDEKYIGVSNANFQVFILELEFSGSNTVKAAKVLTWHQEHQESVDALCWSVESDKLFSGDKQGHVIELRPIRSSLMKIIDPKTVRVLKDDGPIVQIQASRGYILVSSTKRTSLVSLVDLNYKALGTAARDGVFGACSQMKKKEEFIYAARPGKRMWCCDKSSGKVLSTLKFETTTNPALKNFGLLLPLGGHVVTWNSESISVLDISRLKGIYYKSDMGTITFVSTHGNICHVIHGDNVISRLTTPVEVTEEPKQEKAPIIEKEPEPKLDPIEPIVEPTIEQVIEPEPIVEQPVMEPIVEQVVTPRESVPIEKKIPPVQEEALITTEWNAITPKIQAEVVKTKKKKRRVIEFDDNSTSATEITISPKKSPRTKKKKNKEQEQILLDEQDRLQVTHEELERKQREQAERIQLEQVERMQREQAERMQREEAERIQREQIERMQREQAERIQREQAERIQREEAEQVERMQEKRKREEEERKKLEEERKQREEAERLQELEKEQERLEKERNKHSEQVCIQFI